MNALAAAGAAGADVTAFNCQGMTVLHVLCTKEPAVGSFSDERPAGAVRRVLAFGLADVNARCRDSGRTPLHGATDRMGSLDTISVLLAHGADVHAVDYAGRTPMHYARTASAVSALLAAGADPLDRDLDDATPAHYLVRRVEHAALVELLLRADPGCTRH